MESKLKYLEMIQNIISRMANNSFFLKGWSVTVVSALFALASANSDRRFAGIAMIPVLMFWILDAYFLRQERLYRKLYDAARKLDEKSIHFSMDTSEYGSDITSWARVVLSQTLLIFYGTMLIAVFGAILFLLT
jgi:hypothetical protein